MGILYWIAIILMGSGAVMLHFTYEGNGLKRIALIFATVVIMALGQGIMTYEYVVLRGGFKIHNCIYGVFGALLFGALILWASKMVFKFEYERFRVLLGVMAIIAGWLGGNGIDLVVAHNSGFGLLGSSAAVYMLCLGALLVSAADIAGIAENFSLRKKPVLVTVCNICIFTGILLMIAGKIIG